MSKQNINLGTPPTGGDGDTVRTAFDKTNQNFGEIFSEGGSSANAKALNGLTGVADRLPYFTGAGALSLATLTAKARELLAAATQGDMRAILELVKQTSAADTTAGAMLAVGAFGIGAAMAGLTDANAATVSGFYWGNSSTANLPGPYTYTIFTNVQSATNATQIATRVGTGQTYIRAISAGTWGTWAELWTSANLVKQTSSIDTTAGAMLAVGAANLFSAASSPAFDSLLGSRFIRAGVDGPQGATICGGLTIGVTGAIEQQIAGRLGRWHVRSKGDSTGDYWSELWHSRGSNSIDADTGSLGYGTGAGGSVTQATSKSTAVTLNKPTGNITLHAESMAANSGITFVLNNDKIAALDTLVVNIRTGGTVGSYVAGVAAITAGTATIYLRNMTAGALAQAVQLSFTIIKGASS